MSRKTWDDYFKLLTGVVASKSKDRSTKVGCVIVGPDNEIRTTGYNSFPRKVNDDREERHERPEKYFWTEHAERNAIYNAARVGTSILGCRAYLDWFPCMDCARGLAQSGIVEVICTPPDFDNPKWGADFKRTQELFDEVGIKITHYE